jgi:hypothetical protein
MHSVRWFECSGGRLNQRNHHRCDDGQMRNVLCPSCTSVSLQLRGCNVDRNGEGVKGQKSNRLPALRIGVNGI